MASAQHTLNIIIRVTDKATKQVEQTKKKVKSLGNSVKSVSKKMNGFGRRLSSLMLGMGLSFLFTGMAIKKFFEGILRSLTSTFLTVMGETSQQVQQVNKLKAAWEFLKFRIMSALVASGLWDVVIDKIKEIITNVTEWVSNHEELTAKLVAVAGVLVVIGAAMMIIGQTVLGILGFMALWGILSGAISLPLLIIVGIVALIIAGFIAAGASLDTIKTFIQPVVDKFKELGAIIKEKAIMLWEKFSNAIKRNKGPLKNVFEKLKQILLDVLSVFGAVFSIVTDIVGFLIDAGAIDLVIAAFELLVTVISTLVGWLKSAFQWVSKVVDKIAESKIGSAIGKVVSGAVTLIKNPGAFKKDVTSANDFILPARGGLIKTHPDDTIMGFKGDSPPGTGGNNVGEVNITINNANEDVLSVLTDFFENLGKRNGSPQGVNF